LDSKLPHVTAAFWVMKIAATTLGETAGDLLSMTMNVGYALSSVTLISAFFVSLTIQLLSRRYHPALYWTVILTTSTAGTTMSDYMDRTLGLGYAKGAAILVTILLCVFGAWRLSTGSLSVDHVRSRKAELFYWIAILFSNTLGTALGDFLSDSSGLGFIGGALLIGGLLAIVLAATFFTPISRVLLFWGRLRADPAIRRDGRRRAHEAESKRRPGTWHRRVIGRPCRDPCGVRGQRGHQAQAHASQVGSDLNPPKVSRWPATIIHVEAARGRKVRGIADREHRGCGGRIRRPICTFFEGNASAGNYSTLGCIPTSIPWRSPRCFRSQTRSRARPARRS
jgi:uncharacterized membrane-anchored protein